MEEEKVRSRSLKKYNCKRNKGEHEWLEPTTKWNPHVRCLHKDKEGEIDAGELLPELKLIKVYISLATETKCRHCGKKIISFFNQKL